MGVFPIQHRVLVRMLVYPGSAVSNSAPGVFTPFLIKRTLSASWSLGKLAVPSELEARHRDTGNLVDAGGLKESQRRIADGPRAL